MIGSHLPDRESRGSASVLTGDQELLSWMDAWKRAARIRTESGGEVSDSAGSFYYGPLATIEPTAISLGRPVDVQYAYSDIKGLQSPLVDPFLSNSTTYIAWEHLYLQQLVQDPMNAYGGGVTVPAWASTHYDSLYVVRLNYASGTIAAQFTSAVQSS